MGLGQPGPRPGRPANHNDEEGMMWTMVREFMTPEDHYSEAMRLLDAAKAIPSNHDESNPAAALLLAEAQVHAALFTGLYASSTNPPSETLVPSRHPAQLMPAPKGYRCPVCSHNIENHREHGCDVDECECPAPFGRIMPGN